MDCTYSKAPPERDTVAVFYKFKTEGTTYIQNRMIADILERIQKGLKNAVIIMNANLSPTAKQNVSVMTNCQCQTWLTTDLLVNPTTHVQTPRHRRLSQEEEEELIKNIIEIEGSVPTLRNAKQAKAKMAKMHSSRIISKWYLFPVGSIIELKCNYAICGGAESTALRYRVVI